MCCIYWELSFVFTAQNSDNCNLKEIKYDYYYLAKRMLLITITVILVIVN